MNHLYFEFCCYDFANFDQYIDFVNFHIEKSKVHFFHHIRVMMTTIAKIGKLFGFNGIFSHPMPSRLTYLLPESDNKC